jgi:anaerobic ribonucleoside-triphosphate reductase activating protein
MNVARILYPVQVLGPGNRIGLWLCGCARACKGCSNPELWNPRPEYEIEPNKVFELIDKIASAHKVDGFTISGGEPMDQAKELSSLIKQMIW